MGHQCLSTGRLLSCAVQRNEDANGPKGPTGPEAINICFRMLVGLEKVAIRENQPLNSTAEGVPNNREHCTVLTI